MKFIKTVLIRVVAVVFFMVALVAASANSDLVALEFLGWRTPEFALSYWLLLAFLFGVVLTSVYNLWANTRLRLAARSARKNVDKVERDMDKLKASSDSKAEKAEKAEVEAAVADG